MKAGDENQAVSGQATPRNRSSGRPFLVWASLFMAFLVSPMIRTPGQISHLGSQWGPPLAQAAIVFVSMAYTVSLHLRKHRLTSVQAVLIVSVLASLLYAICQDLAECWVYAFGPI